MEKSDIVWFWWFFCQMVRKAASPLRCSTPDSEHGWALHPARFMHAQFRRHQSISPGGDALSLISLPEWTLEMAAVAGGTDTLGPDLWGEIQVLPQRFLQKVS